MTAQRGMSLVELAIALAVAVFVGAASYKAFLSFNAQSISQKRIAAGQSEIFPIQSALEKNLRRASYQIPLKAPRLLRPGVVDTVAAVSVQGSGTAPQSIAIRGNFSEVATQIRVAFPKTAAIMEVKTDGTAGFAARDTVLLNCGEFNEYVTVIQVGPASRLITGTRLYDYPAGTNVVKVSTVQFLPDGTSLSIITDGTSRRLTGNLSDMRFAFIGFDGKIDSTLPYQADLVKSIQYRLKIRIPKVGGRGYLYRETTGKVLLRNIQ